MGDKKLNQEAIERMKKYLAENGMLEESMDDNEVVMLYETVKASMDPVYNKKRLSTNIDYDGEEPSTSQAQNKQINERIVEPVVVESKTFEEPMHQQIAALDVPLDEKVRLLTIYHQELHKNYDEYQRSVSTFVEWGKPILHRPLKPLQTLSTTTDTSPEAVYVSKFGRNCKKRYADLYVGATETSKKKKSDDVDDWSPKKEKSKSRAFSTPKTVSSRSEKMFDQLTNNESSAKKKEVANESFTQTLRNMSDESDNDFEFKEESEVIKRVIPPIPGKKGHPQRIVDVEPSSLPSMPKRRRPLRQLEECPVCKETFSAAIIETHMFQCRSMNT